MKIRIRRRREEVRVLHSFLGPVIAVGEIRIPVSIDLVNDPEAFAAYCRDRLPGLVRTIREGKK